jgi:hypothetical protein
VVAEIFHITNVYGVTAGWVGGRGGGGGGWVTIWKIMPLSWLFRFSARLKFKMGRVWQ